MICHKTTPYLVLYANGEKRSGCYATVDMHHPGGGKVFAAVHPIESHDRVMRFLFGLVRHAPLKETCKSLNFRRINHPFTFCQYEALNTCGSGNIDGKKREVTDSLKEVEVKGQEDNRYGVLYVACEKAL